jgi:BtpA family.
MKIFPVVHIDANNDLEAAKRDSNRAFELGADGIYLINRRGSKYDTKAIFETFNSILDESADRYVGLNILGLSPLGAMRALARALENKGRLTSTPSGLLIDDMCDDLPKKSAMEFKNSHPKLKQVRLVGGIAVKGTKTDENVDNPDVALYRTVYLEDSVDVVMTRGAEPGQPPTVEKLYAMKKFMGNKPLAVMGGISAENIDRYKDIVDEVLVSARVETGSYYGDFDTNKLKELIEKARDLAESNTNKETPDLAFLCL